MAAITYWFLSPSVLVSLLGKLQGGDRTEPTPAFDWRKAKVEAVIPARNEERVIAQCLQSLIDQNFPIRNITVVDDASSDRTAEVVRRFRELSKTAIRLATREKRAGKTATLHEACRTSDADALFVLDGDTVLADRHYVSRVIEELFKNAGTASACGEVLPLTEKRLRGVTGGSEVAGTIQREFFPGSKRTEGRLAAFLRFCTVIYRSALYMFLHRVLYDGQLKIFGSRLNPTGCAVAYRTQRLRECFEYAAPRMGNDLSTSEDVFIGHFFTWKGYRNVQAKGVRCESLEPGLTRLPNQIFLWSSSFLQSQFYFKDLPLGPLRQVKDIVKRLLAGPSRRTRGTMADRRRVREQYRFPWGEDYTHRHGRGVGWSDLLGTLEKASYPCLLIYFAIFNLHALAFTILADMLFSACSVAIVADKGSRWKYAGMMIASTPVRLLSAGVDLVAVAKYLLDVGVTGNRAWRK